MSTTSYEVVYDRFLSKITDYELAELEDEQLETNLFKFLKSAITDFKYSISNLSDRDETEKCFNILLTETEEEILAKYMLVHWITPHILRLENIRERVGSKDFQLYSGANFLDKITALKKQLIGEAEDDMVFYYYAT